MDPKHSVTKILHCTYNGQYKLALQGLTQDFFTGGSNLQRGSNCQFNLIISLIFPDFSENTPSK